MRVLALIVFAACGSAVPAPPPSTPMTPAAPVPVVKKLTVAPRAVVDPIAALAPSTKDPFSILQPGAAQLALDATPIDSPGPAVPFPVTIVGEVGSRVRVAVRLDHARFLVWTERSRLYALLLRDERVARFPGHRGMPSDKHAVLRAGAPVTRLAHKDAWTHVRHTGTFEVEGWVPDAALGEEAPARERHRMIPRGHRTTMVTPGAVIRAEPKWASAQLAVMANGYFVEELRSIDAEWSEVTYSDGDVSVTGYVSKRGPPGRVHRKRPDSSLAPVPVTPNTKIASGTCLHARVEGDPIGYIVGDRDVDLADAGRGWWTVTLNTPWGPVPFAARGVDAASLASCAPKDAVPAPAIVAPTAP